MAINTGGINVSGNANIADLLAIGPARFTSDITVVANIYAGNILTDNYFFANGSPFSGGGGNATTIVNGTSNVAIATTDGNVVMGFAGSDTFTFGTDGNLTFLHGSKIAEVISPVPGNYALSLSGTGLSDPDQQLLIYPTFIDANHLHITSGNLYNTELFLGNDDLYVKLANTGSIIINSNDNAGNTSQWQFGTDGSLSLAATNVSGSTGEASKLVGTRTIVGGLSVTSPYSAQLAAGGTPTVAYLSTAGVQSTRVTFAIQSGGSGYQWEQFDVVATSSQDNPGTVNFVVSNRVKSASGIADTVVTATLNGSQIEISLTLDAAQTSGGASSFNAVEFGLMID